MKSKFKIGVFAFFMFYWLGFFLFYKLNIWQPQVTPIEHFKEVKGSNKAAYVSICLNKVIREFNITVLNILSEAEPGYLAGSIKLIKSIRKFTHSIYYDTILLELANRPLSEQVRKELSQAGWKICRVNRIGARDDAATPPKWRDQFTKLLLWNMTDYEAVYFFDSDTFVVGNIDSLLKIHKKFDSIHRLGVTRDMRTPGKWESTFNTGVYIVRPNRSEFERLIELKQDESVKFETIMSEQGFQNVVFKDQWFEIGFQHNAMSAVFTWDNKFWRQIADDKKGIRVIHYTLEKPWKCSEVFKELCDLWNNFE
jgi:hypothetical protein